MSKINLLPKDLINKIAAGEVVERPSSVIKELLENSIDAGSKNIKIYIEEAGTKLIKVVDDGEGIEPEDLSFTLEQHATSKIKVLDDLFSIKTLGFRGEALASISAVSETVIIHSKTKEKDGSTLEHSEETNIAQNKQLVTNGTVVEVHNLFKNIPARKKFLKSLSTEKRHIYDMFISLVLPFLDIHFELYSDGNQIYKFTATNDLKNRLFEVFGKEFAKHITIDAAEANNMKITGVLGDTHIGQKKNKNQFIYINNRSIKSALINQAVVQGYTGHMHRDLKPSYVLFIEIDPKSVDINIHPRKLEVKFEDERTVFGTIYNFVNKNLEKYSKEEIKDDFNFTSNFNSIDTPVRNKLNPIKKKQSSSFKVSDAINFSKELYQGTSKSRNIFNNSNREEEQYYEDRVLINDQNVIQLFNTYIAFEKNNEFFLIDQHAAAEKIMFEKLLKQNNSIKTKPLLVPEVVSLNTIHQKENILEQRDELKKLGFLIEDFGKESIQIIEIPELTNIDSFKDLINELLSSPQDLGIEFSSEIINKFNITKDIYLKLATISCHGSIRAGQRLHREEMTQIANDVLNLETGNTCPHGRPIIWKLKKTEIENIFNRDI
ncbi:DNA mismatch repair endonuclease MutL [Candidatus Dojkabacteria bacterium]|uniref:DNA mismatch repair protein MutL n=1 Tax=Candidatus Dojkabacteria bacterium TaxID=2099670 RepID=A0A955LBJ1_9BACT|nr:DNA mismatch repair endonuclease MutL [Candidatus Dojkabacteria bacterium]